MSRFLSSKYRTLDPYVPGEQPKKGENYIKLNTNESPFPPSPKVAEAIDKASVEGLKLYSDPASRKARKAIADFYGIDPSEVVATNGSDEALTLAFFAYCGGGEGIVMPDVSYGFYPVLANLLGLTPEIIPLKPDYTIDVDAFCATAKHVVFANPNAPTGIVLPRAEIERILRAKPDRIVIVDEAYVDFGGESCIPLIKKYDNLIVVQTFSKSRSLAGGRLGFAAGNAALMSDLDRLRDSMNPYNINTLTELAGIAAIQDRTYFDACREEIIRIRARLSDALKGLGFTVLPSATNFVFAKHPAVSGKGLYSTLKDLGILVRHFDKERIRDFVRISVGSAADTETLIAAIARIIKRETSL